VGVPAAGFGVTAWLHLGSDLPGQVAAVVLLANGVTMVMLIQRFWLNAQGRSGLTLSHDIINTVVNLALTFPLILAFGALGTITATLIAALLAAVYLTWIGQRRVQAKIPVPWRQVPWGSTVGAFVISGASTWAVAHFLAGQVIPLGPLSLLAIGASAAPALLLYFAHTVGLKRVREIFGSLVTRRG
jgi:O-antigen/teichoic acid export membrane protein